MNSLENGGLNKGEKGDDRLREHLPCRFAALLCLVALALWFGQSTAQESRLGTYRIEEQKKGRARPSGEYALFEARVKDARGTELSVIRKNIPFDVPFPTTGVFESGRALLIHSFDGLVEFYDRSGALVRSLRPLKDAQPEYERVIRVSMHDSLAALLLSEPGRDQALLFVVDHQGRVIAEKEIPGTHAAGVEVSPEGTRIAAGTYTWRNGELVERMHVFGPGLKSLCSVPVSFNRGVFSDPGDRLVAIGKRSVSLVDLRKYAVLWTDTVPAARVVLDATWSPQGVAILSAPVPEYRNHEWVYASAFTRLIGEEGAIINTGRAGGEFKIGRLKRIAREVRLYLDDRMIPLNDR
ncbi:MAG: hypothetical protein HYZ01_00480 [Ignavibacteriales bacterium]|nr:hypothetical protein [Ignavibacteriales bacterium]